MIRENILISGLNELMLDIIQSISDLFLSDGLTVTLTHPIILSVSRRMRSSSSLKKFIVSILTPDISEAKKSSH
jgi:hypothetical protein